MNATQARVNQIRQRAADAFAQHETSMQLNDGVFRSWLCKRPGTGIYAFRVTTWPGHLAVTGDIGELIVARLHDMLKWVPGAIDSIQYFAEKVPQAIPTREYDADVAREAVQHEIELARESEMEAQAHALEDFLVNQSWHFEDASCFYRGLQDIDGYVMDDPPDTRNWTSNFLWCREAIRWLMVRLELVKPYEEKRQAAEVPA